jgi:hypothetical protein
MKLLGKLGSALSQLSLVLFLFGCSSGSAINSSRASVSSIKANPLIWRDQVLRLEAYLVSTDHGAYLADSPNDEDVLGVSFAEREHRKATAELLEKLARAHVGKPYAQIHGLFEGRLTITSDGKWARFQIYSEVVPP